MSFMSGYSSDLEAPEVSHSGARRPRDFLVFLARPYRRRITGDPESIFQERCHSCPVTPPIWKPPRFLIPVQGVLEIFSFFLLVLIGVELLETLKAYFKKDVIHVRLLLRSGSPRGFSFRCKASSRFSRFSCSSLSASNYWRP